MWECNFAGETMDYKLFWLRFIKKIWMILGATVLGALLVGVPYYLVNVTFGEDPSYKIVSEYYLDYGEDSAGNAHTYFNYYTWSEIVDTDEFVGLLREEVPEEMFASFDTLRAYTDATVESDPRYLSTTVVTEHPDKTIEIARAMERTVLGFAKGQKELNEAKVVTMPTESEKTYPDVRPVRAFVLGAVLGLFAGLLYVSIMIVADSSVFLPSTLEKRYQIKALGCASFTESKSNVLYLTKDAKSIGVFGTGNMDEALEEEAVAFLKETLGMEKEICIFKDNVLLENFDYDKLRNCDTTIFLVKAGIKNGKKIERILEQIRRQDVELAGGFLYGEDKKLLKRYYR